MGLKPRHFISTAKHEGDSFLILSCKIFVSHPELYGPSRPLTSVVVSPLYHAYAFAIYITGHMAQGAKLIVAKTFDEELLLQVVEKHKVSI